MIGIYDINDRSDLPAAARFEIYKNAGFSEVAFYIDNAYMANNETYEQLFKTAKEFGLAVNQVHADYKISNEICNEESNIYFDYVDKKLSECEKHGVKYLVVHASKGDNPPIITNQQISKLAKLTDNHPNVVLCFENVRNNINLESVLNAKIANAKMCFDLGHAHAYSNEKQLYNRHASEIYCAHLHNNYGTDSHNPLWDGEIDVEYFLKKLISKSEISICLECFPPKGDYYDKKHFVEFIKKCKESTQNKNSFIGR